MLQPELQITWGEVQLGTILIRMNFKIWNKTIIRD